MSVAFVIGHNHKAQGAFSEHLNETEYNYWNDFYNTYLTHLGDRFTHSTTKSYTKRQKEMAKITADYDLVFELHFNGGVSSANGVEALVYHKNSKMAKFGELYCEMMSKKLGLRNRGCKLMSKGNGFGFLKETKGNAIILEPFFGSNKQDCERYDDYIHARIIENLINEF